MTTEMAEYFASSPALSCSSSRIGNLNLVALTGQQWCDPFKIVAGRYDTGSILITRRLLAGKW
jgi:hypothetical protein